MDICLALGGGGIKGIAHLGVIQCLEEAGFKIRAVAGTSAGGLVGSVYAAGYSPREILSITESLKPGKMYTRQSSDRPSLLGYTGLAEALTEMLGDTQFSDLKIPFACTAVDIRTSQEMYLNQGRVLDAVLATIAIPGVFPSKLHGEEELVDGSVLDPVPVSLARCLAPRLPVVAVVLNPAKEDFHRVPEFNFIPPASLPIPPPLIEGLARMRVAQAFRIFVQSMDVSARMLTELRLEIDRPDVIIRPDVYRYGLLDVVQPQELVQAGELAAVAALPLIHKTLSWPNRVIRAIKTYRSSQVDNDPRHLVPPPGTTGEKISKSNAALPDKEAQRERP